MDSPFPGSPGVRDQVPSETPELTSDTNKQPGEPCQIPGDFQYVKRGTPLSEVSSPTTGDIRLTYIDSQFPGSPGVRDQVHSEKPPELASDTNMSINKQIPGDNQFSYMHSPRGSGF